MKRPTCVKDVQNLMGCMVALSHFILHLGEKGLPFFKLLKANERFEWTEEADKAFTEHKQFLTLPPIMTAPQSSETTDLHRCDLPGCQHGYYRRARGGYACVQGPTTYLLHQQGP